MSTILTAAFQTIQRDSAICFPMLGNLTIDPPSYFTVFGFKIYFYGVIIALGFILGIVCCTRICARFGIKEDDMYDTILVIIPTAIIGARLYYVLFELDRYLANPAEIFALRDGGLAIYGGVIAVVIVAIILCRSRHIKLGAMMDLVVMGLLIGQAIGRWGNFLNREAFGAETTMPWRMQLTTTAGELVEVHPTFLYESLWNLIGLLLIVFVISKARRFDGENTCFYFLWYGVGRFWIEGLRTDSLMLVPSIGLRASQLMAGIAVVAGIAAEVYFTRKLKDKPLFVPLALNAENKAAQKKLDGPISFAGKDTQLLASSPRKLFLEKTEAYNAQVKAAIEQAGQKKA